MSVALLRAWYLSVVLIQFGRFQVSFQTLNGSGQTIVLSCVKARLNKILLQSPYSISLIHILLSVVNIGSEWVFVYPECGFFCTRQDSPKIGGKRLRVLRISSSPGNQNFSAFIWTLLLMYNLYRNVLPLRC